LCLDFTQRTTGIYSKSLPQQRTNRERQFLCFSGSSKQMARSKQFTFTMTVTPALPEQFLPDGIIRQKKQKRLLLLEL
jgi:hypothetical protein